MVLDDSLPVHPLTYLIRATSLTGSSGDLREIEGDDEAAVGIRSESGIPALDMNSHIDGWRAEVKAKVMRSACP